MFDPYPPSERRVALRAGGVRTVALAARKFAVPVDDDVIRVKVGGVRLGTLTEPVGLCFNVCDVHRTILTLGTDTSQVFWGSGLDFSVNNDSRTHWIRDVSRTRTASQRLDHNPVGLVRTAYAATPSVEVGRVDNLPGLAHEAVGKPKVGKVGTGLHVLNVHHHTMMVHEANDKSQVFWQTSHMLR